MKVAIPQEITPHEHRVALVPDSIVKLAAQGLEILVQAGAGHGAHFADEVYAAAGAEIVGDAATLYSQADIVLKVQKPTRNNALRKHEVELMREGSALIALLQPLANLDLVSMLAQRQITAFSMDLIPRISRAQPMDALSAMSTLAGYKAVLIAANSLGKLFPLMMTAAGTLAPARVLILGAGVAGLQAIATARRLGAVVEAFDTRPVVKEQVQSLGATFVELEIPAEHAEGAGGYAREMSEEFYRRERELVHRHVQQSDVVITTALVPGKQAPVLITEEMVQDMRAGSVIVDLAAEMGGNCALTVAGEDVERHGVIIHGPLNLPSAMPVHASQMYSRNISSLLGHLLKDNRLALDLEDEITRGTCVTHQGRIVNEQVRTVVEKRQAA